MLKSRLQLIARKIPVSTPLKQPTLSLGALASLREEQRRSQKLRIKLIGRMRENKRAARASRTVEQFRAILWKTIMRHYHILACDRKVLILHV